METAFLVYQPQIDAICVTAGLAFAQYIAQRAGLFSLATSGFAAIGAYTGAILLARYGVNPLIAIAAALALGGAVGGCLALPLARLRGAYQALATVGFVEIVVALCLYSDSLTGGALGLNGIPKVISTLGLVIFVAATCGFLAVIGATGLGRAFDAIRQDETVAESLGIRVARYHAVAFVLSGAIAGVTGCLLAFNTYSITPEQFGFPMLVLCLASAVLGGRLSVFGPIVGAIVLIVVPELARPLAESRYILHGVLLIVVVIYLPLGIVDTLQARWRAMRSRKAVALADQKLRARDA
jgi:branched-chain amino acid transport system permease protein